MPRTILVVFAVALALPGLPGQDPGKSRDGSQAWSLLRKEHDKDQNGKITKAEYSRGEERFARLDRDGDGVLSEADFSEAESRGRGNDGRRGRGERRSAAKAPAEGDPAPDFNLLMKDGKTRVKLSDHRGKRPVALIFGSYT